MTYNYRGLWKVLIDRNLKKKDLMSLTGISSSTIAKMGKGLPIRLEILARICKEFNCNIGDILEIEFWGDKAWKNYVLVLILKFYHNLK